MATWALVLRTQAQFQAGSLHCSVTSTLCLTSLILPFFREESRMTEGLPVLALEPTSLPSKPGKLWHLVRIASLRFPGPQFLHL